MVLSWEMAELLHFVLNLSVHRYVQNSAQNYFFLIFFFKIIKYTI